MTIISRIFASISIRVAHLYFRIRAWWPIWFYVINGRNCRTFQRYHAKLSTVQKRIVEDLNRDGIAVAHLDELFSGSNMQEDLRTYTMERVAQAETKTHKSFLKNLWEAVPVVDIKNPFIRIALNDEILSTVNEYMGMLSYFFYLTLNVTTPVPAGSEAVQSQRWHGDPEDKKMCKVFIYLTDVDERAGPFIYVRGTHHGGRWRHLFRQQPPRGFLPLNRPIEELVPASNITRFTGKAGTIIFCDTSGYHRGGYATAHERVMATIGYCSAACAYPLRVRFDTSLVHAKNASGLTLAARHALGFSRSKVTQYFFHVIKPNFKYGAD